MPMANFFEYLVGWPGAAATYVVQPLTDRLIHIGPSGQIEESLIRLGILNHDFRFTFDRQDNWLPGLFELLHKLTGIGRKVVTEWMSLVMSSM